MTVSSRRTIELTKQFNDLEPAFLKFINVASDLDPKLTFVSNPDLMWLPECYGTSSWSDP
jgi:hypothetical protein